MHKFKIDRDYHITVWRWCQDNLPIASYCHHSPTYDFKPGAVGGSFIPYVTFTIRDEASAVKFLLTWSDKLYDLSKQS